MGDTPATLLLGQQTAACTHSDCLHHQTESVRPGRFRAMRQNPEQGRAAEGGGEHQHLTAHPGQVHQCAETQPAGKVSPRMFHYNYSNSIFTLICDERSPHPVPRVSAHLAPSSQAAAARSLQGEQADALPAGLLLRPRQSLHDRQHQPVCLHV